MNTITPLRLLPLLLMAVFCAGCAGFNRPLGIEPIAKKPLSLIQPEFKQAYYRIDRDGTAHFYMHSTTTDPVTKEPVEQIAVFRMFWRPIGGTTTLNPEALNCTYRYILLTPSAVGMYEGAGFLRLNNKPGSPTMSARLVDGDLRLTEASSTFVDNLGRSRIRGKFSAKLSDAQTLDLTIQAQQKFFTRSLVLSGKTVQDTLTPKSPDNLDK